MYKIYINGTPLFLTSTLEFSSVKLPGHNHLKMKYIGKPKFIFGYIDMLEKNTQFDAVILYANDVKKLYKDFKSIYKVVKAAGGVVKNDQDEILFIYRMGHWDLPKGKIEKGEKKKVAAVREVQEETGIQNIELQSFIKKTYHTYRDPKKRRVLKITHWYKMKTNDSDLVPQGEEGIELVEFMDLKTFSSQPRKVYGNILDILNETRNNE